MGAKQVSTIKKAKSLTDKLKAGKSIAKPTTATIQETAALQISKTTGLPQTRASELAKNVTDDIIGFTNKGKGWMSRLMNSRPAYEMAHGAEMVSRTKQILKASLPSRLNNSLIKEGITLNSTNLMKLSDDVVELVATKPFNTIESMFSVKWGSDIAGAGMKIAGAMAQEAVNFGIVGTAMDYVGHLKGEVDLDERSLFDRGIEHILMGGVFGGIKYVPGGRGRKVFDDIKLRTGKHTRNMIKSIDKMDEAQLRAFARFEMKNHHFVASTTKGANITRNRLREKTPFGELTKKELKAEYSNLREALKKWEKTKFENFKDSGWISDGIWDIVKSTPRMALGAWAFNAHALKEGAFNNMPIGHAAFHIGIGAIMTKKGRALFEGRSKKFMGMEFGEKPYVYQGKGEFVESSRDYVYDSDLRDILISMENSRIATTHIKELAAEYSYSNLNSKVQEKVDNKDIVNIINTLESEGIIFKTDQKASDLIIETVPRLDTRLLELVSPVINNIKLRGYEINPKATKKQSENAIKNIYKIKSEVLGDADNPIFLNTSKSIRTSLIQESEAYWKDMETDVMRQFENMTNMLAGKDAFVRHENAIPSIPDITFDSGKHGLNQLQSEAFSKYLQIKEKLITEGRISVRDVI